MSTGTIFGVITVLGSVAFTGYKIIRAFARIEFILTGADGQNGIRSDVTSIKKSQSDHTNDIKDIKRTLHGENDDDPTALVHKIGVIERRIADETPNPGRRRTDLKPKRRKTA